MTVAKAMTIALLGDSMVEMAGPDYPALQEALRLRWREQVVQIVNHGVAQTRADHGLFRLTHDYIHREPRRCVAACDPDILVMESFAYSHRYDGEKGPEHVKTTLGKIIDTAARVMRARVVVMAMIPPDRDHFCENHPNWSATPAEFRASLADCATRCLEAAAELAHERGLPLANVYEEVQREVGRGTPLSWFIDPADNIHPSTYGFRFAADIIARTIREHDLVSD